MIVPEWRKLRKRGKHIQDSNIRGDLLKSFCFFWNFFSHFQKKVIFQLGYLLFSIEDFFFVFLEFWSDEPLGIRQCLFSDVISGNKGQIRLSDLDSVAEYFVVTNLQRRNASFFSFLFLQKRNEALSGMAQFPQLIQFRIVAILNDSALCQ